MLDDEPIVRLAPSLSRFFSSYRLASGFRPLFPTFKIPTKAGGRIAKETCKTHHLINIHKIIKYIIGSWSSLFSGGGQQEKKFLLGVVCFVFVNRGRCCTYFLTWKMTAESPSFITPVKVVDNVEFDYFRSSHCFTCTKNIHNEYKEPADNTVKLFCGDKKKEFCKKLEKYLSVNVDSETDLNVVCKACYRSVGKAIKAAEERNEAVEKGRGIVNAKFRQIRTKRELPSDVKEFAPQRRKRLVDSFHDAGSSPESETITDGNNSRITK